MKLMDDAEHTFKHRLAHTHMYTHKHTHSLPSYCICPSQWRYAFACPLGQGFALTAVWDSTMDDSRLEMKAFKVPLSVKSSQRLFLESELSSRVGDLDSETLPSRLSSRHPFSVASVYATSLTVTQCTQILLLIGKGLCLRVEMSTV